MFVLSEWPDWASVRHSGLLFYLFILLMRLPADRIWVFIHVHLYLFDCCLASVRRRWGFVDESYNEDS